MDSGNQGHKGRNSEPRRNNNSDQGRSKNSEPRRNNNPDDNFRSNNSASPRNKFAGKSGSSDYKSGNKSGPPRSSTDSRSNESREQRQKINDFQQNRQQRDRGREKAAQPDIEGYEAEDLNRIYRDHLQSLNKANADTVAKHLLAAADLIDIEPEAAYEHALAAHGRAIRIALVRETLGVAAYRTGRWKQAITELKAARRISGNHELSTLIADCERALGKSDKALEIINEYLNDQDLWKQLDVDTQDELLIIGASSYIDLDDSLSALALLEKHSARIEANPRVRYAYADTLLATPSLDNYAERAAEQFETVVKAATWIAHQLDDEFAADLALDASERIKDIG